MNEDQYWQALKFLGAEFGKGFITNIDVRNPLYFKVSNKAPWQVEDLIQFADTLQQLKSTIKNYPKLIKKLRAYGDSIREGIPFLDIAQSFLKEKLTVEFLEENNKAPIPDIEVTNPDNNEKFYVEVTKLFDGNSHETNNFQFIIDMFFFNAPGGPFTGKLLDLISKDEYPEIRNIVLQLKNEAYDQQKIVSYSDNRIELYVAPGELMYELEEFCNKNGMTRNNVTPLPMDSDEIGRVITRVKNKQKQISPESNGLIYFPVESVFFWQIDLNEAAHRIEECLRDCPNVIGAVMYADTGGDYREENQLLNNHFYISKMMNEVVNRQLLFVFNNQIKLSISRDTLKKIYASFT